MLYFDVTRIERQGHHSGLVRVSTRLRAALAATSGPSMAEVVWHRRRAGFVLRASGRPILPGPGDRFFTPELFCEEERPGVSAWIRQVACPTAALFHDAIPLRFPEITWPQSVARHPHYMRLLADFSLVFANSQASATELAGYWRWAGLPGPEVRVLPLGADGLGVARAGAGPGCRRRSREVVMVGILEPRKNQDLLLDAAQALWDEGVDFLLTLAGRVNPHFGRPIAARVRRLKAAGRAVVHVDRPDDAALVQLMDRARFSVLPSRAEGCGLPVLESLWAGVPVVVSALPALTETAAGGGCLQVPEGDGGALREAMRSLLADDVHLDALEREATCRALPTWSDSAAALLAGL